MMDLQKRISIISEIVNEHPGLGKTAMMKYIYLLQKVYNVPFGYEYSIYTYGPYASLVMDDVDYAYSGGLIDIKREVYANGSGYHITLLEKGEDIISKEDETIQKYKESINKMMSLFKDKSAKDLELLTTIIYIHSNFITNNWPVEEVPDNVHEIKPHFDEETIKAEFKRLDSLGVLKSAS